MSAPELLVDLEADNILLRAALEKSTRAGVAHDLLAQELQHRIGNLLAVVSAVARQTFRDAAPASLKSFGDRVQALAAAQKVLIESETQPALMADVVASALAPHAREGDRFSIAGPQHTLDGRRAHALTLALHELATNASKYGALSVNGGRVDVNWSISGGKLEVQWRETGGPSVSPPTRRGFGTTLITRNLGAAFLGEVDLAFEPAGVTCRLVAPA